MRTGEYATSVQNLRDALGLWRGAVVHQGQWGAQLRAQVARLEARRFYPHTTMIDADLCLGRHRELICELASLVVEHPLHESAHALLMIALHRAGRASAALEADMRFRQRMLHELGIEPSERIQALHLALLSADARLSDRSLTSDMLLDAPVRAAAASAEEFARRSRLVARSWLPSPELGVMLGLPHRDGDQCVTALSGLRMRT